MTIMNYAILFLLKVTVACNSGTDSQVTTPDYDTHLQIDYIALEKVQSTLFLMQSISALNESLRPLALQSKSWSIFMGLGEVYSNHTYSKIYKNEKRNYEITDVRVPVVLYIRYQNFVVSGRAWSTMETHIADIVIDISGETGTDEHSQTDCIIIAVYVKSIEVQTLEDISFTFVYISRQIIMDMLNSIISHLGAQARIAC